jgi:hypothetical protein
MQLMIDALKEAAAWPGADQRTPVVLATPSVARPGPVSLLGPGDPWAVQRGRVGPAETSARGALCLARRDPGR